MIAAAVASVQPAEQPADVVRVESIEVRRINVFSEDEAREAFIPYGFANAVHVVTLDRVVRKQLLFEVGDVIDRERLAETERLLRQMRYFRKVSVEADGGRVVVETQDAWTLFPRFALARKGGVNTYSVGVEEGNLLGTGRRIQLRYEKDVDRTSRSILLVDPQALGPHAGLRILAQDLSDGQDLQLEAGMPFYALDVPRAASGTLRYNAFDAILYSGGIESTRWDKKVQLFRAEVGRLLQGTDEHALRAIASVEWNGTELTQGSLGPPPPSEPPRRFLFAGLGLEREGREWLKRRNVNQMDRDEDFNLAPGFGIEAAVSPNALGARGAARLRGAGSIGIANAWGFALASLAGETRLDGGPRDGAYGVALRAYAMLAGVTVAAHVAATGLHRPDPEDFLELDGLNGMRGYDVHAVAGSRRLVANLEARAFLASDVLHIFSLGGAAFVDEGFSGGAPDGFVHLTDVGIGLRFGLTRASLHSMVRVDVARALRPDPLGRTGWLFSFATGQAF